MFKFDFMQSMQVLLDGGDLRSLEKSSELIREITTQKDFDRLFKFVFSGNRLVAMRAIDIVEKLLATKPLYIQSHKKEMFALIKANQHKEIKWHLALILPRIKLNKKEIGLVWQYLTAWSLDTFNSKIVRVNSVQGLFDLLKQEPLLKQDFLLTMQELEREQVPSINARIRILLKKKSK